MSEPIKILSWNVHMDTYAKDNSYVINQLEELNEPDIICFQEYVEGRDKQTLEWLKNHDYLLTYLPFAQFPENNLISQGVLTATKKSLSVKSVKPIVLREDVARKFRPFPNIRGVIECVIMLTGGLELNIYNVHSTLPRPYTIDMRRKEFKKLIQHMDKLPPDRLVILCGDFNFLSLDKRKIVLKRKFNFFTGGVFDKTWKHHPSYSPISANLDYIFWSKSGLTIEPKLLPKNHSDHRPIVVEIAK